MLIESDVKLNFSDVMIRPKRTSLDSRSQVNLVKQFLPKYGHQFSGVPIIAANMATGTFEMLDVFSKHQMFVAVAKFESEKWFTKLDNDGILGDFYNYMTYGFYTIGMSNDELLKFNEFYVKVEQSGYVADNIKLCVDIANGYSQKFAGFISKIRDRYPNIVIVAGNVATPDMTMELILAGADYIKVGISQGSKCSTRLKTAVGYPQLSAIIECADAAHGLSAGIIADGGIRSAGDFGRAFCANADMVMAGGIFAGTDECHGELISRYYKTGEMELKYQEESRFGKTFPVYQDIVTEKKFKLFYGMSSEYAQKTHLGEMKNYRTSEGLIEEVPYVGSVETIVNDILGGLRSTGTYVGADDIKKFGKCATFIRTNQVHDKF